MNKLVISIVGPTAIGKTKLAIAVAQHYQAPIISADSRQFFKEMNIGTAVPSSYELAAAQHYFIQHKSILESYSVGDFEREAMQLLPDLFLKSKVVVLVGGSGLYLDAVTKGLNAFPKVSPDVREMLNKELEVHGVLSLQDRLKKLDPAYYSSVDLNNPQRLVRALEICIGTGKPYSSFVGKPKAPRFFKTVTIGLQTERQQLYNRINNRVDSMLNDGLLDEVKSLEQYKHLNALQTVGYKELFVYLDGKCNLEIAVAEIKKNTRRFAKRQITWFKRAKTTHWLEASEPIEEKLATIKNLIAINEKT